MKIRIEELFFPTLSVTVPQKSEKIIENIILSKLEICDLAIEET